MKRAVPIPLYYQLAELIKDQVRRGSLKPGDRLPSERELSDRYQISRMTVRQGLAYLVREAAVEIRHGSGTYVAEPKITFDALQLMGFSEAMGDRRSALTSTVLEQRVLPASPSIAATLGLRPDEDVYEIVRVREVERVPVAIETNYLARRCCPDLETVDLSRTSLYEVLETSYGISLERVEQTFEAALVNDREREVFGLGDRATILLVEGTTYDTHGDPVEYFKSSHRGDRFKVKVVGRRSSSFSGRATAQLGLVIDDADLVEAGGGTQPLSRPGRR